MKNLLFTFLNPFCDRCTPGQSTSKASITPETSFSEDLKADSLDLFEMVMAFEEHFGVDIPAEDLEQLKTVGDVMSYVESHKA